MKLCKNHAIILAAGRSSRFGEPKYALRFDKKRTFFEKIVREYLDFGCQIIVVVNLDSLAYFQSIVELIHPEIQIVVNPNPENGRFSSIIIGLDALIGTNPVFIQNIDNPFIDGNILQKLVDDLPNFDGVKPTFQGKGGHPLLLSEKLVTRLQSMNYDIDFKQFLKDFVINKLEVSDPKVLANINTKEAYQRWFGSISTFPLITDAKP